MTEVAESAALLDAEQEFSGATSHQVRDELQALVERDMLGPWDGERENLGPRGRGPRDRYLVGLLGPKHLPQKTLDDADSAVDAEEEGAGTADKDSDLPEVVSPQALGKLWASSMGLSFSVGNEVDVVTVTAEWGHYDKQQVEFDDGQVRSAWVREPIRADQQVRLDAGPDQRSSLTDDDPNAPGVHLRAAVRPDGDTRIVEITLVNSQLEAQTNGDVSWLFQAKLTVTALDGAAPIFRPVNDPLEIEDVSDDPEELHLRLLYRNQLKFANGHNVAVHTQAGPGARRATKLETTWLPTYDVPATVVPTGGALTDAMLTMDDLAEADPASLRAGLLPLAEGYADWLGDRETELADLPPQLQETATVAIFRAKRAVQRIKAGIDLLTHANQPGHADALRAFRFANQAMAAQRRHTELGKLREQRPELSYLQAKDDVDSRSPEKVAAWRPFQLAFVLLNLPSLTDPAHAERTADHNATVDLLFFPTGGGKTEAYLGLTAFTFAIRRLQGSVGSDEDTRSGDAGVAVLMRYTLRLLTAQQFQRAAALVCAAEVIRHGDEATWGTEPFRIGLWVGGSVAPNWYPKAEEQIKEAKEAGSGRRANVLQTLSCPWCGSQLKAHRDLDPREDDRRVLLFCPHGEGADACPFSRTQSEEGLPILTVDEEIYRYAPSLVIATVDKLAQLPWKGYAGILFGRTQQKCPRHGFRHDDLDKDVKCGKSHRKKGKLPAVTSVPVPRLRPPDLIIQDELHLISGALGTTVGLFEAAVDELCGWQAPDGSRTGPKIVASTATTKRSADQVRGIFGRELQIFPPQVTDVADTFFSRQVPVSEDNPGRRYLGICAHGVRLKSAEIQLAETLLLAGQTLFDQHGIAADPYMTIVGYFNATRELAGMRRYLDDDVTTRVRLGSRDKGLSNRLVTKSAMLAVQELTSRISSGDISDVLKRLENGFDPRLDTSERRRAIAVHQGKVGAANRGKSARSRDRAELHPLAEEVNERDRADRDPVDVVLATSMLQVGVDVSRFGLMVVTGQPKNTAEYIQASSRVGRDTRRPGLVLTLYNWSRPRDLAHYEDFEHYHATFYRQVEALSVTPFTQRSLDRGTAAMFVAAVRNVVEDHSRNADAHDVDLNGAVVDAVKGRLLDRADSIGGDRGRSYLDERISRLIDAWKGQQDLSAARVGYQRDDTGKQHLVALLRKPGDGSWVETTVGMSMRETENEINLLVPRGEQLYREQRLAGAPLWSFEPPGDGDNDAEADVAVVATDGSES